MGEMLAGILHLYLFFQEAPGLYDGSWGLVTTGF